VRRAIDFHEGDKVNEAALKALVKAAVVLNKSKAKPKPKAKLSSDLLFWDVQPQKPSGFQQREVAHHVAVVPELFLEDCVDALQQCVLAVLGDVGRSIEVIDRDGR